MKFSLRIIAPPADIAAAVNLTVTGFLGRDVQWTPSREYRTSRNPKYADRNDVRVYVTVTTGTGKVTATTGKTQENFVPGEFDIEIE